MKSKTKRNERKKNFGKAGKFTSKKKILNGIFKENPFAIEKKNIHE